MIVHANTPRSLSWPGWLAVLGLGFGLLPLVPVQAEPPPKPPKPQPKTAEQPVQQQKAYEVLFLNQLTPVRINVNGPTAAGIARLQLALDSDPKPLKPTFLDLDPLANVKRSDNFHSGRQGNNLVALARGVHTFGGVKFKVGDGVLQLSSTVLTSQPDKIEGLQVDQPVNKLHFLHATAYGGGPNKAGSDLFVADGTVVGRYRVHYEDTSVEVIPIIYGKDVRDWWYVEDEDEVNPGNVAWKGDNDLTKSYEKVRIRLYQTTWLNPKPDKKVVRIDFVSTNESAGAPFCVAITAEGL